MAITAPISGRVSDEYGPLWLTFAGLLITALGLFYFSTLSPTTAILRVVPGSLLMGMGAGMFQSPNNSSVLSSVPPRKLGLAGGISALVRNMGMIIGIAWSVSLFEFWGGLSRPGPDHILGFMIAYHRVMLVATGLSLLAALITLNRSGHNHGLSTVGEHGKSSA